MSPPREWLDRFASTTQLQLERFDSRQLCTVLWSLNHHGYRPRAPWVQAFLRASQPLLGHPIRASLRPTVVIVNLVAAVAVTTLAAWIPARRAVRLDLLESISSE